MRHGRTIWNAQRRFLGVTDIGLDDVGRQQAAGLPARVGEVAAVYSSPLSRALETAAALSAAPVVVSDLAELDQGELEGMKVAEAIARHPEFFAAWRRDPAAVVVPGGEGLAVCRDRALRALGELAVRHQGERIAVVTHQLVIGAVTSHIAGAPLSRWSRFGVDNVGIVILRWAREGWQLAPSAADRIQG